MTAYDSTRDLHEIAPGSMSPALGRPQELATKGERLEQHQSRQRPSRSMRRSPATIKRSCEKSSASMAVLTCASASMHTCAVSSTNLPWLAPVDFTDCVVVV